MIHGCRESENLIDTDPISLCCTIAIF